MSGGETKALFAKYFQKDKSQFSRFDKLLILVFVTNFLAITDGYFIWLSTD